MKSLIYRYVPETPSFLLYTHQEEKAERALQWLRGEEADVSAEMATIHGNIRRMREQGADCRRVLVPQLVRPLLLTCGLMFFHRFVTLQHSLAPKIPDRRIDNLVLSVYFGAKKAQSQQCF